MPFKSQSWRYPVAFMLCYVTLCYALLYYAMPCHAMPCHVTSHSVTSYRSVSYCIILHRIVSYNIISHHIILYLCVIKEYSCVIILHLCTYMIKQLVLLQNKSGLEETYKEPMGGGGGGGGGLNMSKLPNLTHRTLYLSTIVRQHCNLTVCFAYTRLFWRSAYR